jgi:hypothetical protein
VPGPAEQPSEAFDTEPAPERAPRRIKDFGTEDEAGVGHDGARMRARPLDVVGTGIIPEPISAVEDWVLRL